MEVFADAEDQRPTKRARAEAASSVDSAQNHEETDSSIPLLSLPDGVLYHVLFFLPAGSLMALNSVCRYFKSLAQRVAKKKLVAQVGYKQAARWRCAGRADATLGRRVTVL
jgi:hypothetical protein